MDLTSKKIYCRKCKKLVNSRHKVEGETPTIVCNGCNSTSYVWTQVSWKYVGA